MILKLHSVLCNLSQFRQRKNLVTATVGQDRSVPIHELMQAAEMFDYFDSRPDEQMIRIPENDLSVHFVQFAWTHCLD